MASALDQFHPEIRGWFEETFGEPTDVQRQAWPRIAAGEHLLATAPTGSGKTLTAFLWAIDAFATGKSEPGATRVLYVSPLKALNNDIRANLTAPIAAIRARFAAAGLTFPALRVQTRSGDTEQGERQRMLRRPPELLITTPESLNLLLTTVRGRLSLATVETVILDEIHSVVENRRGVQLTTGLERLVEIAGEVQRVALSATVRPLAAVARYVGGQDEGGQPRRVGIVEAASDKRIEFRVRHPEAARVAADNGQKVWEPLAAEFRDVIRGNRSTLFFANSRRLAEKITLLVNGTDEAPLAYAHHGSLAREIRTEVEQRLKRGELKAIVATSSLEMGIDIGDLDEVVLVQSPPSIAATVQRVGRAGHRVGETSRGALFPTFPQDFLAAAVLAQAVREGDLEPLAPLANPLDVLAQIVVSCAATETWRTDDLFRVLTRAAPYATLPREHFDLVLEMLAGRYVGTRIRDLRPRLAFDRAAQTVKARRSAVFALYTSGGTIPDRGYFTLRHADSGSVIGELDEEFVWEAKVGEVFSLGAQNWQVRRITHSEVLAAAAPKKSAAPPFWRAENHRRSFHFSERIGAFLEAANERLAAGDRPALAAQLAALGLDDVAAEELLGFLERQREASGCDLPHANHLLIEHVQAGPGGYTGPDREQQIILHTMWGGRVNQPLALALGAAWQARFPGVAEVYADNDAIAVQTKQPVDPALLLSLVTPANFEPLLRQSLEGSGLFGSRFRECAGRALLLTKRNFKQRVPLWLTRLQAKKLMTATKPLADFPLLLETWRTCLRDEFDLPAAYAVLERLAAGELAWSLASVAVPTPFAAGIAFGQIGRYMYADDTPEQAEPSALDGDLIRSATFDATLRPAIDSAVVAEFESKTQRTRSGYVPVGDEELAEWVKERVAIPAGEWFAGVPVPKGVWRVRFGEREYLVHPEIDLGADPVRQAGEMLQFYGPRTAEALAELLPFEDVGGLLQALLDAEAILRGPLVAGAAAEHYCDVDNLETLIRFQRAAARPAFEPRPAVQLAPFLAHWHGFGRAQNSAEAALDQLRGYAAPVGFYLEEALPPRLAGNPVATLEDAATHAGLCWRGAGKETIAVGFEDDCALAAPLPEGPPPSCIAAAFKDADARYTFGQLVDASEQNAQTFNATFWQAVWAGQIAADGFRPLAVGHGRGYALGPAAEAPGPVPGPAPRRAFAPPHRRARARARMAAQGWPGAWHRVAPALAEQEDRLEALEAAKQRCRMLLDRYGVLSREQANREGGAFRWAAVFPALRLMELAGEVVAGLFFEELSGPQFALPSALRALERGEAGEAACFWISALDPASPCGLKLSLPGLPRRQAGNHLGWFDGQLALVSEAHGRRLAILLPPEHPGLDALLPNLAALCRRRRRIATATINGEPARHSDYLPALARHLTVVRDHKGVYFEAPSGSL